MGGLSLLSFPSRTGFPGHFTDEHSEPDPTYHQVSIPSGLARLFSHPVQYRVNVFVGVSIPSGLPRPFNRGANSAGQAAIYQFPSRTGCPGQFAVVALPCTERKNYGFHPDRAPQAIWPLKMQCVNCRSQRFHPGRASQAIPAAHAYGFNLTILGFHPEWAAQAILPFRPRHWPVNSLTFPSRTGCPGQLADGTQFVGEEFDEFPSRAGCSGLFARAYLGEDRAQSWRFHPDRAAQAI